MSEPSLPLSEKARGKRRAMDPDADESESEPLIGNGAASVPSSSTSRVRNRTFTVRFSEGGPDLEMSVTPTDTVREVQRRIRQERPNVSKRRLRLIHAGRLLTPGTLLHGWLASLEDKQSNSTKRFTFGMSDKGKENSDKDQGVWIHCSVGAEIPESELEDDSKIQTTQLKPLRGFDRLTTAGFSSEEIENVRRQFHSSRDPGRTNEEDGALQQNDDDMDEHARALEEQWIDDMDGNQGDMALVSESGIYTTLLQGLLLGFFFPLLPFFYMRALRPDAFFSDEYQTIDTGSRTSVVFSRRMLMAVCFGFLSNIGYGALRWFSI